MADKHEGLDQGQREALRLFEHARKVRDQAAKFGIQTSPLRVRLAAHVDLSKANPSCKRCHGTGVLHWQTVGEQRIPTVCRCVAKGGGVQKDKLDQLLDQAEEQAMRKAPAEN